ncbi:hypothetical protein [Alteromonas sp. 14N.309.X.WAT.G.H12]|uniref:hypothetical protein n=1 Tax=Alteromonas sp. 14N.309.X.WAT.G.H12 TaxID=3120824 RepID=UPI002FD4A08E
MDIQPHIGINGLLFGMNMAQVRSIAGQPPHIDYFIPIQSNPEERDVIWSYENGLELSFSSDDDFLLTTFTSSSRIIKLENKLIVGRPITELQTEFPQLILEEDFEETGQNYELTHLGVSFWVVDDIVCNVLFFPKYTSDGQSIIWPKELNSNGT